MREIPFSPEMMVTLGLVAGLDGRELEGNSNSGYVNTLREALPKAMEELTDRQREVAILYYWEQMTQEEIAVRLKLTQPTVNEHLNRAINNLRENIEKHL
jgi:RNA polymerase sigma factor (sigma-70 family)